MCAQARRRGHPVGSPVFTVVFRPAALDKLDRDMVSVNIPAIPDKAEDQNPTVYYFGKIRQARGPVVTLSVSKPLSFPYLGISAGLASELCINQHWHVHPSFHRAEPTLTVSCQWHTEQRDWCMQTERGHLSARMSAIPQSGALISSRPT